MGLKHPPYQLRPNKAIDRLLLAEAIRFYGEKYDLRGHDYYGLGGPFLEDVNLLCRLFPTMKFTSIESDHETLKRQERHRNSSNISLIQSKLADFVTSRYVPKNPSIFWLDFTGLKPGDFALFSELLPQLIPGSIVKVTMRAHYEMPDLDYFKPFPSGKSGAAVSLLKKFRAERLEKFKQRFYDYILKDDVTEKDIDFEHIPKLVAAMIRMAANQALPTMLGVNFQVVHACKYTDGTQMVSVTGIVCEKGDVFSLKNHFSKWQHSNLDWGDLEVVSVPNLSARERILLDPCLPMKSVTGKRLAQRLGYNIDRDVPLSLKMMQQYQDFYRYYPLFGKIGL